MTMSARSHRMTLVGISCVAAFITVQGHEVLGHGLAAYLCGARSFQLGPTGIYFALPGSSVVFASSPLEDRWIAAAGALFNLVVGIAFYVIFRKTSNTSPGNRFFLWLLATLNLFTLPSYMAFSALSRQGDWQDVVKGLPHEAAIRLIMACGAVVAYLLVIRLVAAGLAIFTGSFWRLTLIPYFVTIIIFCAAALLSPVHKKELLSSAFEGNIISNIGLLVAAPWAARLSRKLASRVSPVGASMPWVVLGVCATLLLLRIGMQVSWSM